MTKKVSIFIILAMVVSLFAGCSSSSSTDKKNVVSIWSWRKQDEKIWKKVEKKLNEAGKDIKIKFRSFTPTQYDASLKTAMNGGNGPDILTLRAGGGTDEYAEAGQIVPLKDKIEGLKNFKEGILGQVAFKDKVYAVPFAVQTSQFFYNQEIFKKYNLHPPKTWDDLLNIMETLEANGVTPMAVSGREGWALNLIIDAVGASSLGDKWVEGLINGKNHFNDPKFVDVIKRIEGLKKYFQDGYSASSYQDMKTLFTQEKVAMIIDGIWSVKTYKEQNPDLKLGSFMAPPPSSQGEARIYAFLDGGYGLNVKSKDKQAAIEVLSFAATKEYGQMYTDLFGEISAYPGIQPTDGTKMLEQAMKRFKNKSINKLFRIRSSFDKGTPGIGTLLSAGIQAVLADKKSPQELMDGVQKKISKWYKPFQ